MFGRDVLGILFVLEWSFAENVCLMKAAGCFLLIGRDCPSHNRPNENERIDVECFGYSMVLTAKWQSCTSDCSGSHKFVSYPMAANKEQNKVLKTEEIEIPSFSVLIGHGYIQYAKGRWKRYCASRYHSYTMVVDMEVKEPVALLMALPSNEKWMVRSKYFQLRRKV